MNDLEFSVAGNLQVVIQATAKNNGVAVVVKRQASSITQLLPYMTMSSARGPDINARVATTCHIYHSLLGIRRVSVDPAG